MDEKDIKKIHGCAHIIYINSMPKFTAISSSPSPSFFVCPKVKGSWDWLKNGRVSCMGSFHVSPPFLVSRLWFGLVFPPPPPHKKKQNFFTKFMIRCLLFSNITPPSENNFFFLE
ncbi:hypothetical protein Dimus_003276 [Dionaea muscipula]